MQMRSRFTIGFDMESKKMGVDPESGNSESEISDFSEVKLLLPHDVARAWQRCTWVIANETKKSRPDIMEEMVRDFLCKYGC